MSEADRKDNSGYAWWRHPYLQAMTPRDRLNHERFYWMWRLWVITELVCGVLTRTNLTHGVVPWIIALVPIYPGFLAIRHYLKFLRHADEMLRKIELEALACGFGAGVVCGFSFFNLVPKLAVYSEFYSLAFLIPMSLGYAGRRVFAARAAARDDG